MLEFDILDKQELVRACELVGVKNKEIKKLGIKPLERLTKEELITVIKQQIYNDDISKNIQDLLKKNEKDIEIGEADFRKTLDIFKIEYKLGDNINDLKEKLYIFNSEKMVQAFEKMSKKKKERLIKKIESEASEQTAEVMMKMSKKYGSMAVAGGGAVFMIHGMAIAITGFNLGLSVLFVNTLSSISTIVGITFPFAAYQTAAVAGGQMLGIAGALSNPITISILISLNLFIIYNDVKKKKYIKIAGLNYLIESKKKLNELMQEM